MSICPKYIVWSHRDDGSDTNIKERKVTRTEGDDDVELASETKLASIGDGTSNATGKQITTLNSCSLDSTIPTTPYISLHDGPKGEPSQLLPEFFSTEDWASTERLGFSLVSSTELREAELAARPMLKASAERCEKHWQSYSRGLPLLVGATAESLNLMRRSVWRYGVPSHLRGVMWLTLSGVALRMDENEGFCRALLNRHGRLRGEHAEAIEKDLRRTFPTHPYFASDGVGTTKARNVLHALCWRNPLLNYCQSFNYLVALMLLVLDNEESTFWLMCQLLENLLPNDLYSEALIGTKVDQLVLQLLVQERLPRLAQHFVDVRFDVGTLVPSWVMVLFVNVFPIETVLRVWDCLFAGSGRVLEPACLPLEIVLAVLKIHQNSLLKCGDAGDVVMCLNHSVKRLFDAEKLVRQTKDMPLSPSGLQRMRRQVRPLVMEEHHQREKRRQALRDRRQFSQQLPHGAMCIKQQKQQQQQQISQQGMPVALPSRLDARQLSALSMEPHHSKYRDFLVGMGAGEEAAVNVWGLLDGANPRSEWVQQNELSIDVAACGESECWRGREESCGIEMDSIRAESRDKEE